MTATTDGRSLVYGVFDGDGYECESLVGVYSTEALANDAAQGLRSRYELEWQAQQKRQPALLVNDNPRLIKVKILEVDRPVDGG